MNDRKYSMITPFSTRQNIIGNASLFSGFSQNIINKYTVLGDYPWNYASLIYLMQIEKEENAEKQLVSSVSTIWKLLRMFIKQSQMPHNGVGNSSVFISNLKRTIEVNLNSIRNSDFRVYEQIRTLYQSCQECSSQELSRIIQLIEKNSLEIERKRENSENQRKVSLPFSTSIKPKSLLKPFNVMMQQVQQKAKLPSGRELFFKSIRQQQNMFYQKTLVAGDDYYDSNRQAEYSQYFLKILQMKLETQQALAHLYTGREIENKKTFFQDRVTEYTQEYYKELKEMQETIATFIRQQEDSEKIISNSKTNNVLNALTETLKRDISQITVNLLGFLPTELFEQADGIISKTRVLEEWNNSDVTKRTSILQSIQTVCIKTAQDWQKEDYIVFYTENEERVEQEDLMLLNQKLQEFQEFETMFTQIQKTGLVLSLLSKATTALDSQTETRLELKQILGNWVRLDVEEQLDILNRISKITDYRALVIDRKDLLLANKDYVEMIRHEELVQLQRSLLKTEEQKQESVINLLQKLPEIVYEQTEKNLKKEKLIAEWDSLEESKRIELLSSIRKATAHLLEVHQEEELHLMVESKSSSVAAEVSEKDYMEIIRREELVQLQRSLLKTEEQKQESVINLLKKLPEIVYEQTEKNLKKEKLIAEWDSLEESKRIELLSSIRKATAHLLEVHQEEELHLTVESKSSSVAAEVSEKGYTEIIRREELVQLQRSLLETEEQKQESVINLLKKLPEIVYEQTEKNLKKEKLITEWDSLEESKRIELLSSIREATAHLLEVHQEVELHEELHEELQEELVQLQRSLSETEEQKQESVIKLLKKLPEIVHEQIEKKLRTELMVHSEREVKDYENIMILKGSKTFTEHLYGKELQVFTLNEKNVINPYVQTEPMIYSFGKEGKLEQKNKGKKDQTETERIETWITKQEYTAEMDKRRIEELRQQLETQGVQLAHLQEGEAELKKASKIDQYKLSPKLISQLKAELHLERIRHGME